MCSIFTFGLYALFFTFVSHHGYCSYAVALPKVNQADALRSSAEKAYVRHCHSNGKASTSNDHYVIIFRYALDGHQTTRLSVMFNVFTPFAPRAVTLYSS